MLASRTGGAADNGEVVLGSQVDLAVDIHNVVALLDALPVLARAPPSDRETNPVERVKDVHPTADQNVHAAKLTGLEPSVRPPDHAGTAAPATEADVHVLEAVTEARLPHRGLSGVPGVGRGISSRHLREGE